MKVNFEYTAHHEATGFEITFSGTATVRFGTPGFTARDGVYEPGEPDEAEITGLWCMGAAMNVKNLPETLYQEMARYAIEQAYEQRVPAREFELAEYN